MRAVYALRAGDCEDEVEEAAVAIEKTGGATAEIKRYDADGLERCLVVIRKTKNISPELPREYRKIIKTPLK